MPLSIYFIKDLIFAAPLIYETVYPPMPAGDGSRPVFPPIPSEATAAAGARSGREALDEIDRLCYHWPVVNLADIGSEIQPCRPATHRRDRFWIATHSMQAPGLKIFRGAAVIGQCGAVDAFTGVEPDSARFPISRHSCLSAAVLQPEG